MAKTVITPVSAKGRVWLPGDVLSEAAEARIDDQYKEDIDNEEVPEEFKWYDGRTVKSVTNGVGDDPERAAYALEREAEREPDSQRSGVFDALNRVIGEGSEDE